MRADLPKPPLPARRPFAGRLAPAALALAALLPAAAQAAPIEVLFIGNSYTFGRVDPVMSYNYANVTDLTAPSNGGNFTNETGGNAFEPRPWGGVPGVFQRLTEQAGLDYAVSMSTRNAASLRGHMLNLNPARWDLRGNIGLKTWDQVVLQEQSDEPLARRTNANGARLGSNPEYFRFYADVIENYVHSTAASPNIFDRDAYPGATPDDRQAACVAGGASARNCRTDRGSFANPNGDAETEVYLYQTWARPNLVDGALATVTDEDTGAVTRTGAVSTTTHFSSLEEMTAELADAFRDARDRADDDGTPGFAGIAPVGESFLRAVQDGVATRDMWADDAATDGLLDLWFDDGTHASAHGSYLSALVLFGTLTGLDPARFGADEQAAADLGIAPRAALQLQRVASAQLGYVAPVPLPASGVLALGGFALLAAAARRRKTPAARA